MANTDTVIANATGQTVREDIQTNLQALKSNNSTSTTPTGTSLISYMSWANTSSNQYQVHNSSAFLPVLDISTGSSAGTHIAKPGTTAIPGYRFLNSSGTAVQSGMGLPADTRLGFFLGGSEKVSVLNTGLVGIGTTAPSETLTVLGNQTIYTTNVDAVLNLSALNSSSSNSSHIDLAADTTYTDFGLRIIRNSGGANSRSDIIHRGTGVLQLLTQDAASIYFSTQNANRFEIKSGGSLTAIGSSFGLASTTGGSVNAIGFGTRTGVSTDSGNGNAASVSTGNLFNIWWDSPNAYFFIDNTRVGYFQFGTSDYRIKRNIENLDINGIERLKKLRPVKYQSTDYGIFKQTEDIHEGFIAHEVQEVIPDAVKEEKDKGLQSIDFLPFFSTLTKALQEAVVKIETLETKVAALEGS